MKKVLTTGFVFLLAMSSVYAQIPGLETVTNNNSMQIEIIHDKPLYVKKGKHTYMFDRKGNLLGYFRKTPSGKVIVYDENGKQKRAYKETPGGGLSIYNASGNKIN